VVSSMASMSAVREKVYQRACEEDEVGEHAQHVGAVFCPQKEGGCNQKHQEKQVRSSTRRM
jgi:hypothetical protein